MLGLLPNVLNLQEIFFNQDKYYQKNYFWRMGNFAYKLCGSGVDNPYQVDLVSIVTAWVLVTHTQMHTRTRYVDSLPAQHFCPLSLLCLQDTGCLVKDLRAWCWRRCENRRRYDSCRELQLRRNCTRCLLHRGNKRMSKWGGHSAGGEAITRTQRPEAPAGVAQQHQSRWSHLPGCPLSPCPCYFAGDVTWVAVWCRKASVDFGHAFLSPKEDCSSGSPESGSSGNGLYEYEI